MKFFTPFHWAYLFCLLICLNALIGCSTSPKLEEYSRSEIDRTYTLPDNVSLWKTTFIYHSVYRVNQETETHFSGEPFYFEHALTDQTSVILYPFPLMLKHQLLFQEDYRFGVFGGISSIGYHKKIWLNASIVLEMRKRLNEKTALQFSTEFTYPTLKNDVNSFFMDS